MTSEEPGYPCVSCDFTACTRQELTQHSASVHKRDLYRCHLCSFFSRHKSSFHRHKRVVHKHIACEICGLPCDTEQDLVLHTRERHADLLSYQEETQRRQQKAQAREPPPEKVFDLTEEANALYLSQFQPRNPEPEPEPEPEIEIVGPYEDLPHDSLESSIDLMPQKFRRQYQCADCEYRTFSPRDYLYHRRDMHRDTNSIYECHMCIYATKHHQKLGRHTLMVHKVPLPGVKPPRKKKPKPPREIVSVEEVAQDAEWDRQEEEMQEAEEQEEAMIEERSPAKSPKTKFPCTKCDFNSKSKFLLAQHEKTVHLRKKFFRCLKCGFVTNERGRYNKHVKSHNLPRLECSECQFNTPYRWNLDRHMKNHQQIRAKFQCKKCSFQTNSSQSFRTHELHHHKKFTDDMVPEDEEVSANGHADEDDTEVSNNEDEDQEESLDWKTDDEDEVVMMNSPKTKDKGKHTLRIFKSPSPELEDEEDDSQQATPRYPCPLCGVVFNQLAWLARHLSQKHEQSPNVKKLAKAVQKLTPSKQPPMTSTPVKTPPKLEPEVIRSKLNVAIKSFPKPPVKKQQEEPQRSRSPSPVAVKADTKNINRKRKSTHGPVKTCFPTHICQVCLYRNTLMSEMEKHVLTHCTDRPFACHVCKFRCRWKGDMKKHMIRNHGAAAVSIFERSENPLLKYIKTVPTEITEDEKTAEEPLPVVEPKPFKKPKTKAELAARLKDEPSLLLTTKSRTINPPARSKNEGYWQGARPSPVTPKKTAQQDSPLDLTVKEEQKQNGNLESLLRMDPVKLPRTQMKSPVSVPGPKQEEVVKTESQSFKRPAENDDSYEEDNLFHRYLEAQQNYFYGESDDAGSPQKKKAKLEEDRLVQTNKKYKCTYCPFMSQTASRFHVHIVQHLNKKPFMCSLCNYRSNWEWDITKHIKIKSSRDPKHKSAQMVITDETGMKNYNKYNKFLVPNDSPAARNSERSSGVSAPQDDNLEQVISPEDLVETVLVTPEHEEADREVARESGDAAVSGQVYRCGHCLFKHPDKKIVISHLGVHFRSKPYRCRLCGIGSSWKHVMLRHVKAQHGGEPNDVEDKLQYVMKGNSLYVSSSSVDKNEQPVSTAVFECHLCPYTSDYNHHMQMHLRQHCPREGANMKCPHCPYWVKYRKTLNSHLRFHPQEATNGNAVLSPSRSSISEPTGDADEMEGDTEMEDMDDKSTTEAVVPHSTSSPGRKYQCDACPFKSDNKSYFLYHKQFHRPNRNAPFKCTHCSYWSCFKNIMNKHVRTHEEPSPEVETETPESQPTYEMMEVNGKTVKMFKCRFCPMQNRRRSNVKTHESQHSDIKSMKFSCPTCSYQTNNQGVMTSHLRLHGEGSVNIASILKSMKSPSDLDDELSPESSPSPKKAKQHFTYLCKKCPAVFKSKGDHSSHNAFHGADLPFTCLHCDYRARHKPHLHRHMTVHTAEYLNRRQKSIQDTVQKDNTVPNTSALSQLLTQTPDSPTKLSPGDSLLKTPAEPPGKPTKATTKTSSAKTPSKSGNKLSKSSAKSEPALAESPLKTEPEPVNKVDIDDPDALSKEKQNAILYSKNQGTGRNAKRKYRCKTCPMAFNVVGELEFHKSLHKSGAQHSCHKCSYAVNNTEILAIHVKLHTKSNSTVRSAIHQQTVATPTAVAAPEPVTTGKTPVLKIVSCPLCPAVFTKPGRLEKHASLHGAKNRYTCNECDYSVRFVANLSKHKKVHQSDYKPAGLKKKEKKVPLVPEESVADATPVEVAPPPPAPVKKAAAKSQHREPKEKHLFQCSHCPYSSIRKDNVVNHMNRHGAINRLVTCPYCDYATSTASFLKDHIKLHFQPRSFVKVRAYMKYDQLEIWACNGSKALIFKDHGEDKKTRFFPEVIEEEPEEDDEKICDADDKSNDTVEEMKIKTETNFTEVSGDSVRRGTADVSGRRSSAEERSLIADAIQVGKKLEVVLTDVMSIRKSSSKALVKLTPEKIVRSGVPVAVKDQKKADHESTEITALANQKNIEAKEEEVAVTGDTNTDVAATDVPDEEMNVDATEADEETSPPEEGENAVIEEEVVVDAESMDVTSLVNDANIADEEHAEEDEENADGEETEGGVEEDGEEAVDEGIESAVIEDMVEEEVVVEDAAIEEGCDVEVDAEEEDHAVEEEAGDVLEEEAEEFVEEEEEEEHVVVEEEAKDVEEEAEDVVEEEWEDEDNFLEETADAGSLILSSIGNDSIHEEETSRRADTPTEVLSDIMDELDDDFRKETEQSETDTALILEEASSDEKSQDAHKDVTLELEPSSQEDEEIGNPEDLIEEVVVVNSPEPEDIDTDMEAATHEMDVSCTSIDLPEEEIRDDNELENVSEDTSENIASAEPTVVL